MQFIPELNSWLNTRAFESPIGASSYDFPTEINKDKWTTKESVINLLFDPCFDSTTYVTTFKEIDFLKLDDRVLQNRLSIHRQTLHIYVPELSQYESMYLQSGSGENILEFTTEELDMLDRLFQYRTTGTADLTGIIIQPEHESILDSELSKLIFLYLNLKLNSDFSQYDFSNEIANSDRLIELMFEKFVLDSYFRDYATEYLVLDSTTEFKITELDSTSGVVVVTETMIDSKSLQLERKHRNDDDIAIILDGELQRIDKDYKIITDVGLTIIDWDGLGLQTKLQEDDRLYVIYSFEPLVGG